ncbi:hypothetical protein [Mucilaginibacter aquatilis]|uniref:PliI/PliC-like inhibitor of I-type lysozyme n=1 Tax=Mucilaginibacter aquatilis TaxID=1517760 RepID=A0A6I4I534_9SPHI|nr:hypothetical protein [Mucilaginibacter aquatilis]MVN89897.1 hypothetical protein [Mucilaginibacter aquatilis]
MNFKYYLYMVAGLATAVTGCKNTASDNKESEVAAPVATAAPKLQQPFRYHKTIEVAPGLYYDVLGWGRGSELVGAYQILRSDSASAKYTTTTGDYDGRIVDVFNSDMDTDGNPEIFIHTQAADSTNYAEVFAFEYNDDRSRKLDFPRLTRSQRKGYRGNDNFFIKDGNLMREFDVFDEEDTLAKKPIQKRLIEYSLRGNSLSASQVNKDSTDNKQTETTAVADQPKRQTRSSSNNRSSTRKSSSSKKKTAAKKETRKKRRRHR